MMLLGQFGGYQKRLQSSGGDGQGFRGPGSVLLNPARDSKKCKEAGSDNCVLTIVCRAGVGNSSSASVSMIFGPTLRINICLGELESTSLSQAKVSLPVEWLTW